MNVPYGQFCENCGAGLVASAAGIPPGSPQAPPTPLVTPAIGRGKSRALVLGVILVIVLAASIAGVAGYMYYQNNQQSILHAAEQTSANSSVDQLSVTCSNAITDTSTLNTNTQPATGYATITSKIGIKNPSQYPIDATWTIKIVFAAGAVSVTDTQSFHLSAKDTTVVSFPFKFTAQQLQTIGTQSQSSTATPPTYTVDTSYTVSGTYSTYHVTRSYDSSSASTSSLGGTLGSTTGTSNTNATPCP